MLVSLLVINTTSKQPGLGTADDDRVARDDRGRHIECGEYLTNHSKEERFEGPKL